MLTRFFTFLMIGLLTGPVLGFQELISIDFGGTVFRWDVSDDSLVYSTNGPSSGFAAMARTNDGRIFATRTDAAGNTPSLFQVNPDDGAMTLLEILRTVPTR